MDAPVILITGASSGFGEATARLFAQKGYRVVLAARRYDRLESLAREIEEQGGQALPVQTDMARLEQVQSLANVAIDRFGQIDVLFNNAGFGRMDWLEDLDAHHDIENQVVVNVLGMIWMAQAVLPYMIQRQSGHVINMASAAGFVGTPSYTVYAATKYAIRGFSEALRREVGAFGVHVSLICPGGGYYRVRRGCRDRSHDPRKFTQLFENECKSRRSSGLETDPSTAPRDRPALAT